MHPVDLGLYRCEEQGGGVWSSRRKEREDARNSEDGVKRCAINVGILSDNRGPVEEAVS